MNIAGTKANVLYDAMNQAMTYNIPEKVNGSPQRVTGKMRHQLPVNPNKIVPDRNYVNPAT